MQKLTLSVHDLVDFLLREGDIDSRVYNLETMQKGSEFHRLFQSSKGKEYLSEYPLESQFVVDDVEVTLEGRADGICPKEECPVIEEIKTTVMDLYEFHESQKEWHLGQARCYALMYLRQEGKKKAEIRLRYIDQKDFKHTWCYSIEETIEELEKEITNLIHRYLDFMKSYFLHIKERNASLKSLPFPYSHFRKGQHEMAKYVYKVSQKGGLFFVEAPTGIGKTISALYPALKGFSKKEEGKIFYLTAKTSGGDAAEDALALLREKGAILRSSRLLAKEKMCAKLGAACNPVECPFAKGYYGKMRRILQESMKENVHFSEEKVKELANHYETCPFELSLDLSLLSDVIVCDYNYVFDPFAHLQRYFEVDKEAKKHFLLIDEAHNLIERGRESYSAILDKRQCSEALSRAKGEEHLTAYSRAIRALSRAINEIHKELDEPHLLEEEPRKILRAVERIDQENQAYQKQEDVPPLPKEIKELSRETHRFKRLYEDYSQYQVLYYDEQEKRSFLKLYCPDPSYMLRKDLKRVFGAVLFSGTLSPISYYMDSLAGEEEPHLLLPSPFPSQNCQIILAPKLSLRYKDREKTKSEVALYLKYFVAAKPGNYLLFMPSFAYLDSIKEQLDFCDAEVVIQSRGMKEKEKEEFLALFQKTEEGTRVGLAVLGGSLSEGIDLLGDRLIGVAIVGIGLPMVTFERELLRSHFEETIHEGFNYAYRFPGMNKVMQALGRLIRSEKDSGAVLLIDDRYMSEDYRSLLSRTHPDYSIATKPSDISSILEVFYAKLAKG